MESTGTGSAVKRSVAIIGGGWAGLAAAVRATELGMQVTLFEASRHWGGRARRLSLEVSENLSLDLDNGQHILIGAYAATLALMQKVGVRLEDVLRGFPLDLRFADGAGLATPAWARNWPAPLDTLAAVVNAQGWSWSDRWSFISAAARWRKQDFHCPADMSVHTLCDGITQRVMEELIEPLCVAALNTPAHQASGQVFLTVLRDALLGQGTPPWRASSLLLPLADLGRLLPDAAIQWLQASGAHVYDSSRVDSIQQEGGEWALHTGAGRFVMDHVIVATGVSQAMSLLMQTPGVPTSWLGCAQALRHEPIATVYLQTTLPNGWPGTQPMLALRSRSAQEPAQYAFLRNALDGPSWPQPIKATPLIAFVASACQLERQTLEAGVLHQAREQLGAVESRVVKTVIEKRATFVCTPGLIRPSAHITQGITAAGDYVAGPYPATLEGAVRSGLRAAEMSLN